MNMKLLNSNIFTNIKFFLRRTLSTVTLFLAIHGHSEAFAQPEPLCDSVTIREIHKNYRSQVKKSRKEFKAIGPEKSRYNRKLYRTLVKVEKERFKEERNSLANSVGKGPIPIFTACLWSLWQPYPRRGLLDKGAFPLSRQIVLPLPYPTSRTHIHW